MLLVEREIQFQDIDARLTEDAEIASVGILLDEFANFVFVQATSFSDARSLEFRITNAYVRIKTAA